MSNLSEQEIIRREKLEEIRKLGINPYPAKQFIVNFYATDLDKKYIEGKKVSLAGRLMSRRIQGSASFAELQDSTGRVQIYFNRDEICKGDDKSQYNEVYKKLLDIGDIIGLEGKPSARKSRIYFCLLKFFMARSFTKFRVWSKTIC